MMQPLDDAHIPGQILDQVGLAVGALRGASFDITADGEGSFHISMRHYFSAPALPVELPDAAQVARVLQRVILPCLLENRDQVMDIPELSMPHAHRYALVILLRNTAQQAIGGGVLLVECRTRGEAERKLETILAMAE